MASPRGIDLNEFGGDGARRIGAAVHVRRRELRLTREQIQADGGPSHETLNKLENGRQARFDALLLARVEEALDWPAGHIDQLRRGGATPNDGNDGHTMRQDSERDARAAALNFLSALSEAHGKDWMMNIATEVYREKG